MATLESFRLIPNVILFIYLLTYQRKFFKNLFDNEFKYH